MDKTPNQQQWHLDKRVPIALIVTLLVQFAAGAWFIAQLAGDVEANRSDIGRLDTQVEILRSSSQGQAVQLGRIEEQISGLREDVSRLLTVIERAVK